MHHSSQIYSPAVKENKPTNKPTNIPFFQIRDELSRRVIGHEAHNPEPTSLLIFPSSNACADSILHDLLACAGNADFGLVSETANESEFGERVVARGGGEVAAEGRGDVAAEGEHVYGRIMGNLWWQEYGSYRL